jgi:hypothetical protein
VSKEALVLLERAHKLAPENGLFTYNLGLCYYKPRDLNGKEGTKPDYVRAYELFEKAEEDHSFQVRPFLQDLYPLLSRMSYHGQGIRQPDFEKAITYAQWARNRSTDNLQTHYYTALIRMFSPPNAVTFGVINPFHSMLDHLFEPCGQAVGNDDGLSESKGSYFYGECSRRGVAFAEGFKVLRDALFKVLGKGINRTSHGGYACQHRTAYGFCCQVDSLTDRNMGNRVSGVSCAFILFCSFHSLCSLSDRSAFDDSDEVACRCGLRNFAGDGRRC